MYRAHFGMQELPFTITPDTSFFFAHSSHQEALNTLLVAARNGEGFIKVIGEVGTGKTLLCRKFLDALDHREFVTAYIPNPYLEPMTLMLAVADELGIKYEPDINQHQLLRLLTRYLVDNYADRKRVILCLDEAQAMPIPTLESLRLLTNLETERRKLMQVVLFGQPELDQRLDQPSIRQLKQRISFSCHLVPLNLEEVEFYVSHRLVVAGYRGARLFPHKTVKQLYKASRGIPRLVNILAHKAMLAAFGEGARAINENHLRLAIADTESARGKPSVKKRILRYLSALVSGAAAFGILPIAASVFSGQLISTIMRDWSNWV
ncbi:MAG: AAA family ATPase [Candidatus Muproteobacteria bacterium RIFCSPHIGHO2_01_FULL_65_16]|uniref:AAA family ATPase n=2 Tax=Candidatus Muproteobacteria TaxID=1817795 RepID=A0A1F6TFI1_9PROT|nr:MAG: AAA family ATPase [Candidatus Muproteobacteria bacterium RIFCSPHIGHO2_01_FULL_65_16]OGI51896.1 MAG: AAA family ATPase [Candidatus Muproteobacteria bacterium RIFCSPHIGHO2_02_FULL_65_16]